MNYLFIKIMNYRTEKIKEHSKLLLLMQNEGNVHLIFKIFLNVIERTKPVFEKLIADGIAEGIFKTEYPDEAAELYIYLMNILKNDIFRKLVHKQAKDMAAIKRKILFYEDTLNRILGTKEKSIDFSTPLLKYINSVFTGTQ